MKPEPNPQRLEPKATIEARLIGLGELSPREHSLGVLPTWVGSDNENDLVIDHPTVSRKHAVVRHQAGRYTVADLDSSKGTFVNGRRITQPAPIEPGDEVGFGAAKFAMVAGTSVAPVRRRHPVRRIVGPLAGITLFACAGFLLTRYALDFGRIQSPAAKPSAAESAGPVKPVAAPREAPEPAAESSSAPAASDAAEVAAPIPIWLKQLNDFRGAVNLGPVTNDEKLTDGDHKHAIYLLKNSATEIHAGSTGAEVHSEDASNSWYTPEGAEAAHASDIAEQGAAPGGKLPNPLDWAIEGWIVAPFHRLPMLSPLLHEVGFGFDCEDGMCVALLNVLNGADPAPRVGAPLEHPILFPPEGGSIPSRMRTLDTEWPNPLSGCEGYAFPVGIPISVQLGPMVEAQLNSFSIARDDGAEIEACGFDANSYYNSDERERTGVINNLRMHGAIVIVPRRPLEAGARYEVLAMINGRDYKWSFAIAR